MRPAIVLLVAGWLFPASLQAQSQDEARDLDHRRMMDLLGIESLRPGANGLDTTAWNYANYDESLANPYPGLPDPLLTLGRERVTTPEMWWSTRRPELVELFEREVYGRIPDEVPGVAWSVATTTDSTIAGRRVVVHDLVGRADNSAFPAIEVEIEAILVVPADSESPVPVLLQFGFPRWRFPGRQPEGPTWQEQVIERGWAFAILNPYSIQADNGGGLNAGIIGLANLGEPRTPDDWGALRAWAWGAGRLLDHLESLSSVDASRVALQGHSRFGKAAAVALAFDQRFATAFVSSSGQGGLKLHRRNWGEIIENVAGGGEYHWMAGNYLKYAGPLGWDDLPVDAHQLISLMAPRPVFVSSGDVGDYWVDARGMFLAAAHAGPVYELLGARGLGTDRFPPVGTALVAGDVAYRQHEGGHTAGPNWPVFLDWASRYLDR